VRRGLKPREAPPDGFDRLNAPDRAPVAVALSGGGDSLALLHLAKAWADRAGRPLVALTVDHGLQAAGAAWSRFAAERAGRLGVAHRTLAWTGEKPRTGLPAAARAARHALLADAARALGARVILMGHTADDLAEAEAMRQAGATAPSPRAWSPSPAWPEGRGVFILRPLLGARRFELRGLLRAYDESWIEDPANDDPRFSRTLARRHLAADTGPLPPFEEQARPCPGLDQVRQGEGGELTVPRAALPTSGDAGRLLGAMVLSAAGTTRPPSTASLDRLLARSAPFAASLAGARIDAGPAQVMVCREAGERARGGMAGYELPVGESVFDGRFAITAEATGWRVAPLAGLARRLPEAQQRRLRALPPAVRPTLPAAILHTGEVTCPALEGEAPVRAFPLAGTRLFAALGAIPDEASIWRVAKSSAAP
jgi:tRNA(Ile)-lysidine synthase